MSKPNSVQWFLDKLIEHRIIIVDQTTYGDKVKQKHEILLEQAKAMHKEEIIEAHDEGEGKIVGNGAQYYNNTFSNENNKLP